MSSQQHTIAFCGLMMLLMLFLACSQREDNSVNPVVKSKNMEGSGTSFSQMDTDPPEDTILCQVRGDTLIVTHQDAWYQCCLESKILVHRSNYTLDIVEYDVGEPCDCMCTFDLTTTIIGLRSGTYTVQVWSELGQFYGKCVVEIPSGPSLSSVTQSDCQSSSKRSSIEALRDSIVAELREDTLVVVHFNAFYNCCSAIDVMFNQDGAVLNFIEQPHGEYCNCMCYFDITSKVVGLSPGSYIIRVWNEDQSVLFGETDIVISPGAVLKVQPLSEEPPRPNRRWWYETRQEGCKTISKRNQSITMNSYRMRRNVYERTEIERRYGDSHDAILVAANVRPCLTVGGGN